jgi:vesicular inhibitory amino acid transporter
VAFNLFCCVYGIGTLGMPGNFSSAGPVIASIALFFMACVNVYASVACSKVLLAAPHSVKTYGDLGEWSMGTIGRILVVVSQMGVCLLISCAFLVLGGILLEGLFPQAFSQVTWIVFMALMVLPVCLTPTLKEGAGAAFAGCMGTIIADIIGVLVLLNGMSGHGLSQTFPLNKLQIRLETSHLHTVLPLLFLHYNANILIQSECLVLLVSQ